MVFFFFFNLIWCTLPRIIQLATLSTSSIHYTKIRRCFQAPMSVLRVVAVRLLGGSWAGLQTWASGRLGSWLVCCWIVGECLPVVGFGERGSLGCQWLQPHLWFQCPPVVIHTLYMKTLKALWRCHSEWVEWLSLWWSSYTEMYKEVLPETHYLGLLRSLNISCIYCAAH